MERALLYHEPSITTLLIQTSFFLLLNLVGALLDRLVYCGLVGQVLVGVAWGTPGAQLLPEPFEKAVTQLGYLGLVLLVFEGGLSTSVTSLWANLFLSLCVAFTGIMLPIAFSFSLVAIGDATSLQAFAAGAALCSTSLGTTFSVLKTSGLTTTRLGTVLTNAAMMDDVVGLVMVQVIANLGKRDSSFTATTVIRPVLVSVAFAVVVPLLCKFLLTPVMTWLRTKQLILQFSSNRLFRKQDGVFLLHTLLLVGLCAGAAYGGTSILLAAYLAGAVISWLDETVASGPSVTSGPRQKEASHSEKQVAGGPSTSGPSPCPPGEPGLGSDDCNNWEVIQPAEEDGEQSEEPPSASEKAREKIQAKEGGKGHGGGREFSKDESSKDESSKNESSKNLPAPEDSSTFTGTQIYQDFYARPVDRILKPLFFASIGFSIPITQMFHGDVLWRGLVYTLLMAFGKLLCGAWLIRLSSRLSSANAVQSPRNSAAKKAHRTFPRPKSLYPASILGAAMVARGEIGFLISAVAQSNGIFESGAVQDSPEIFLIVSWAILLCTIVGPVAVGVLARRVQGLQRRERANADGREDPLGIWGVLQVSRDTFITHASNHH